MKQGKTEVFSSRNSYADEKLPRWISTMKDEFPDQPYVCDREASRMLEKAMTGSHFVLEHHGSDSSIMKSSTKKDFIRHNYNIIPQRHRNQVNDRNYCLTDFEGGELIPRSKQKFVPKERLNECKYNTSTSSTTRAIANVSLGNDRNDWKSVSSSDMIGHPLQAGREQTEYEALEKKRSTVIDYPDLELEPMITVQQVEFALKENLDRSTLVFDNSVSKKALKGTHFTLGNGEKMEAKSEYLLSFVPLQEAPRSIIGAKNSEKSCIIAEDDPEKGLLVSSQKLDYQMIKNFQPSNSRFEIKVC
jgi:hypothetical protein